MPCTTHSTAVATSGHIGTFFDESRRFRPGRRRKNQIR